jgi:site-specific DNA recombinase
MKAIGYVRVSSEKSVDKQSAETQREQIEGYCRTIRHWNLLSIYEEPKAVSGATMDRPQLRRLLADAESSRGKFQVVVVADLSRFGRNTRDLLNNVQLLHDHSIKFASIRESIDDSTPHGKFNLQILASLYELERETIRIRTSENRNALRKKQEIFLGWTPYGYRWDKLTKKVETVDEEKAIYHKIVNYYLQNHYSFTKIVFELQLEHVPTRTGKGWQQVVVGEILKRPCYWSGRVNSNGDEDTYRCEAFITKSKWDEIQNRIRTNRTRSGRPTPMSANFLLYGALRCGYCGSRLQGLYGKTRQNGTSQRVYVCGYSRMSDQQLSVKNRKRCSQGRIPADEIEKYIWDMFVSRLISKEEETVNAVTNGKQLEAKEHDLTQKIENLKKEGKKIERAIARLDLGMKEDEDDVFSFSEFKKRLKALNAEKVQNGIELDEAQAELDEHHHQRETDAEFRKFADNNQSLIWEIQTILQSLPFAQKQKLLLGMLNITMVRATPAPNYPANSEDYSGEELHQIYGCNWKVVLSGFTNFPTFKFNETIFQEVLGGFLQNGSGENTKSIMDRAVRQLGLSARAYHRILKVARTIADLEAAENIGSVHLLEAIQYRSLDRRLF